MGQHLLLLIPSDSYRAADFLAAADAVGMDVVVACDQNQTLEHTVSGKLLTLNFLDLTRSTQRVLSFSEHYPIVAVVPTEDRATSLASVLSKALNLPHNTLAAVEAANNKKILRERLKQAGLPCPDFQVYSSALWPETIADGLDYPVVLKPTGLSGSQGVIRANGPDEFVAAFQRIKRLFDDPDIIRRKGEHPEEILVEQYIPGKEVALEGFLLKGALSCLALFDKPDPLEGPYFEETIYVTPSRIPHLLQQSITTTVAKSAEALGLTEGPIHAEIRIDQNTPYVIELAARSIGGRCASVLRFGTGFSLEEIIIRHALGKPLPSLEREKQAAGVMMIPIPQAGILKEIKGLPIAKQVTGINDIEITALVGQSLVPLPEGRHYLGFIFAKGKTPEFVESALRQAHQKLTFVIDPSHDIHP